jgi:prepilin-type processing-associated H-X9-DG protein
VFFDEGGRAARDAASQYDSDFEIPSDYVPRLDRVGGPASKVWAADGTRVVRRSDGSGGHRFRQLNFSTFPRQNTGGSFMGDGPELSFWNNSPYYTDPDGSLTEETRRYAYRHDGTINAVFFDGHVENFDNQESRSFERWVPTGTEVVRARRTDDPDDSNGDIAR